MTAKFSVLHTTELVIGIGNHCPIFAEEGGGGQCQSELKKYLKSGALRALP